MIRTNALLSLPAPSVITRLAAIAFVAFLTTKTSALSLIWNFGNNPRYLLSAASALSAGRMSWASFTAEPVPSLDVWSAWKDETSRKSVHTSSSFGVTWIWFVSVARKEGSSSSNAKNAKSPCAANAARKRSKTKNNGSQRLPSSVF